MHIETVMWLLPIVFMIHDFEEIIFIRPWMRTNADEIRRRFPRIPARILTHFQTLSTSALAIAVAEEFVLISAVTLVAVERGRYALWTGLLLVFLVHLVVHWVQFALFRRYIPVLVTTVPAAAYGLFAVGRLHDLGLLDAAASVGWAIVFLVVVVANIILMHILAARFDRWLKVRFPVP